ncbi:MAG TPA: LptF/LptG family permease, partial [Candidatus Kapabacteria bacterium]|nr:LptF/LptG family permease [Candidatus Kapabacteria bacterium]
MKTLHLYLTRQVMISLLMTVGVFTFVLLLGNVMKEIIALLVSRQVTLGLVGKAIGLLIPYVMAYVLPFGMLTSVLLVFGRFSADQELTAVRASGVSLISLVTPILMLSLALCVLCGLFNLWIAPHCRGAYKDLIFQFGARTISTLITEDRFIDEIPGMILYIRKKNGDELEDIRIYNLKETEITNRVSAASGKINFDPQGQTIQFQLNDVLVEHRFETDAKADENFIGPPPPEKPPEWQLVKMGGFTTDPIDLKPLFQGSRKSKLSEMDLMELIRERNVRDEQGVSTMPVRVQIHRQLAFSFACFAFTLVAIPLAIQAHRRETSIGIA